MPSYVFFTTRENAAVALSNGVIGVPEVEQPRAKAEILSDLSAIRSGDDIFFYVKNEGLYGVFKARGEAFLDPRPLWSDGVYPYRVSLRAGSRTFRNPIDLADLYHLGDSTPELLWSWRSPVRRSCLPFTRREGEALEGMFFRVNFCEQSDASSLPLYPEEYRAPLPIAIEATPRGKLKAVGGPEAYLRAHLLRAIARGEHRDIFGAYTDFVPRAPIAHNQEIDILLLYETRTPEGASLSHIASVELKVDGCGLTELKQAMRYEDWVIRRKTKGDHRMATGMLVGYSFQPEVVDYLKKRKEIEDRHFHLVQYRVQGGKVQLERIL